MVLVRLLIALLGAAPGLSLGATFSVHCDSPLEIKGGCAIRLSGPIVDGDAQRLALALSKSPPTPGFFSTLLLDSPGGDVEEALRVAEVARSAFLETSTTRLGDKPKQIGMYQCASACFIVWAAGTKRKHFSSPTGKTIRDGEQFPGPVGLGLHRPYFAKSAYSTLDANGLASKQQELTLRVKDFLSKEAIPHSLVEEMVRRSSREILWLDSQSDLHEIPGSAPWFEELLIAKCQYDPVRDRAEELRVIQAWSSGGAGELKRHEQDHKYKAWLAWRQGINRCLFEDVREAAQNRFRRSGP